MQHSPSLLLSRSLLLPRSLTLSLALAVALACATATAQTATRTVPRIHGPNGDSTQAEQLRAEDIVYSKGSAPGISSFAVVGASGEAGLYLQRIRMEAGAGNPAHTHPDARITTVLSGTVYYGIGTVADRDKATAYGPGSVFFTPAGTPHFALAGDGPAVYEEAGFGPSKIIPAARP